jgi:hypothetical protein
VDVEGVTEPTISGQSGSGNWLWDALGSFCLWYRCCVEIQDCDVRISNIEASTELALASLGANYPFSSLNSLHLPT